MGLLHSVWTARRSGLPVELRGVDAAVVRHTAAPAWRFSHIVSAATYCWLVLGLVWTLHSAPCATCRSLKPLVAAVVITAGARAAIAIAVFRSIFLTRMQADEPAPRCRAATAEEVSTLPIVRLSQGDASADGTFGSCAVCLTDFQEGDRLRRLPCGHHFHRHCVDVWLVRCDRCPLCMHRVGEECSTGWAHTKAQ